MKNSFIIRNIFADSNIEEIKSVDTKKTEFECRDDAIIVAVFGIFRVYQVSNARKKISDFRLDFFPENLQLPIEKLMESTSTSIQGNIKLNVELYYTEEQYVEMFSNPTSFQKFIQPSSHGFRIET